MLNQFFGLRLFLLISVCNLFTTKPIVAQTHSQNKTSWIINSLSQEVFIPNHGQFNDIKNPHSDATIKYGTYYNGVIIFFTSKGFFYCFSIEDSSNSEKKSEREEHKRRKYTTHYVSCEWVNAATNPLIQAEQKTAGVYTFGNSNQYRNIAGVKKIIYKNIYPKIDVEFTLSEKGGIKYSYILHTGANPLDIKMKYEGANATEKNSSGNIIINTPAGNIIDHAPVSFYENKTPIASSFHLSQLNVVTFNIETYDNTQTIIIDPWQIAPALPQSNRGFRIRKDGAGNIYLFGGAVPPLWFAGGFTLKKYTAAGGLIWSFQSVALDDQWIGDLAVDPTGNSYISDIDDIEKVNATGASVGTNTVYSGQPGHEIWRLEFDPAYSQLIMGGGTVSNKISNVSATLAPTGSTVFPTPSPLGAEIRGLTASPNGNFYAMSLEYIIAFTPAFGSIYTVPSGYYWKYAEPKYNPYGGRNSITASNCFVYTTNGDSLYKRDINTGAVLAITTIPNGGKNACSGICVDSCGYVYAGAMNRVNKFDGFLNFISSAATPDTVMDVMVGAGGEIVACGKGFLASLSMSACSAPPSPLTLNASSSASICTSSTGAATVNPGGGAGSYAYSWLPGGQTTQSISNISGGTYTVIVTDAGGCLIDTTTVTVTSISPMTATLSSTAPLCNGASTGIASVSVNNGSGTYTYSWLPGGQTTQNVSGLSAGTYTVYITDSNGCTTDSIFTITQPAAISLTVSPTSVLCYGQNNGTATAAVAGGNPSYSFLWNTLPTQTTAAATGLSAGNYTVVVTDANNCTTASVINITQPQQLIVNTTDSFTICNGENVTLTATPTGGSPSYSYSWNTGTTGSSLTVQPTTSTSYTITITDTQGCSATGSSTVHITQPPVATAKENASITTGQSITLSATGGISYTWKPAESLNCSTCASPTASPLHTTIYCVTATNSYGCEDTACVTIIVDTQCDIYVPTAFSPNGDGENDIFYLIGKNCYKSLLFKIYNRWGELVFEADDITIGWDGTYKNKPMDAAVFVYDLNVTLQDAVIQKSGNISLIK